MTARDIIERSLRLVGSLAPGESASAAEGTDGLTTLNSLIDSWSNERLLIYEISRDTYTLTASQNPHTIGSGGDFDTTRPLVIERAGLIESGDSVEIPVRCVDYNEWARIADKSTESTIPYTLWYNPEYPLGKIYLYPVPSAANTLVLYTWAQIGTLADLDTSISLPEGYERMIAYNLALELAPEYGKQPDPYVVNTAREAKANCKRVNLDMAELLFDPALPGSGRGTWDYRTGEYR